MSDDPSLPDAPPQSHSFGGTMDEVQRSLGRIEGTTKQILETFKAHKEDDKTAFEIINKAFEVRDSAIAELNVKIASMKAEQDRAKGAGWAILGLLGSLVVFLGWAVNSVLNHKIIFKF